MPETLVSRSPVAPAASPVRMKPWPSRATMSPSHSVCGSAPRKQNSEPTSTEAPSVRVTPLVGHRDAGPELARLGDRATGQLRAADAPREPEVVLDPARGVGLTAEDRALDDQRVRATSFPDASRTAASPSRTTMNG